MTLMASHDLAKLIMRTSLKDRAAFDELYQRTSAKLFGVCLRILGHRQEAEEALQEVYIKVWLKADRYAVSDQSPISWLVAVARNQAIDRLRIRSAKTTDLDAAVGVAETLPDPEANAVASSTRRRIEDCFGELENVRAEAVRGAYLNGDSYADLAARYDVPLNTMRTWLRRSLIKLKECLER